MLALSNSFHWIVLLASAAVPSAAIDECSTRLLVASAPCNAPPAVAGENIGVGPLSLLIWLLVTDFARIHCL